MKLFKKILIICCFSLLFIINVKADETKYIIPSIQESKIDIFSNFISSDIYSNFIEDVRQGNFNQSFNSVYYDFTDNYVIDIDFSNLNNYSFDVRFFRVEAIYSSRLDTQGISVKFTVTFDNVTHEIVSRNFVTLNTGISYNMSTEINSEGNQILYMGAINSTYPEFYDGTFLNSVDYTFLNGTYFDNGNALLQLNQGNYARREQVPTKYFFDTLNSIFITNYVPIISQPYTEQFNNYTNTIFKINNYSYNSIDVEGLRIDIINNNNGNREFIQPNLNGEEITITKTDYENTSYTIQLYDNDYNIIEEYSINANVMYYNENFNVNIFNINNQNKTINYSYDINYEDDVYCYHVINSSNEILDPNCKASDNNYQLTLNNNGNVQFIIKNSNNEILFKYNQNFVFDVSQPYINFIDKFENNFLTLDVIINRFNSSDVVRYSINNGEYFIVSYFENINLDVGDVRKFTISNLNNNDVIKVQILRNNSVISESSFNVFFNKYPEEDFNLKNFFNKIDINNISNDLREYIINIGNIIINSKIGNLILLQFFILIITWVLKLIVNWGE